MTSALPAASLLEATAPPERRGIARDEVRLLWTDRSTGRHSHASFRDLASMLRSGDLLVVNDSATVPAALHARRANGTSLRLHIATMIDRRMWMTEPRGDVVLGEELLLPAGGSVVMIAPVEPQRPRLWYAWFQLPLPMYAYLRRHGEPIRYGYVTQRFPLSDYQTIFAREQGSSEMPSAARPFTTRVIEDLQRSGVEIATVTLHCGVASFENGELPAMERYAVSNEAAQAVNRARAEGRRVIAIGTTPLRALESALLDGRVVACAGWTGLIIDAARGVNSVDGLLTGFHDAGATHQWILRAFLDEAGLAGAYAQAANNGYYQHEFGDLHLIL